ncbi:hypothetical protein Tco_0565060 [Tanacetum coccineum]
MSLRGQGVKTEILRILAGQVITVAAMADKLSYATVYEGASDTGKPICIQCDIKNKKIHPVGGYGMKASAAVMITVISARYSSPNLVRQRPDGIAYVAAILHMLMLHLQTTRKEHVNRLAQQYPSEKVIVCFAQTAVFSESSQQPLEVEWASYIQPSIPQAHMPCDDDVQHNAVVKGVPHSQNENPLDRISSDGLKEGTTSGCGKRITSQNLGSDVFQVQPHIGVRNVRPRLLANFADVVDCSILGVTVSPKSIHRLRLHSH